jgi:toxin ParE1/3/4
MTSNGSATKIALSRPESARRVAETIVERIGTLETFPHLGRLGRVSDTREIIFAPLPFVAIYEVFDDREEVWVLRILHGAQEWPRR